VPFPALAAIALGSNLASPLGDRDRTLRSALRAIDALPTTRTLATSRFHATAPVGPVAQGEYLNACVLATTHLPPRELLEHLLEVERRHGRDRTREQRWGPRTLDLDLLLYADTHADGSLSQRTLHEAGLTLPHPRMHERRFVLAPLAEVWPDALVPLPGGPRTVRDLLAALAP
jgi:2-amino-4-hydroxy-6-hydroxymethyldihydropteridine diphosphokinase